MNYIKLGKPSDMVSNTILNEIYLSKHLRLSEVLHYYDLAGIVACVTMEGNIVSKRLHTHISITCADAAFKNILSGAINGYNA